MSETHATRAGSAAAARAAQPGSGPDAAGDAPEPGEFRHAFRIGARWILIPAGAPAEVSPTLACTRLPFTAPWCLGLASFRGDLVPIYDLGALLGETAPGAGSSLLILGQRESRAGLRIDEIAGFEVPQQAPRTLPSRWPGLPDGLDRGGLLVAATVYAEIDLSALLAVLAGRASLLAPATIQSTD
jgi:hypothetical protein